VGLDMSYHGGIHSEFEDVSPSEMKAYKARKSGLRRRSSAKDDDRSEHGAGNDGDEDEDDDASWTDMTVASNPDGSKKPESAPRKKAPRRQSDIESINNSHHGNYSTYSLGEESEFTRRS
jgi:hypothetical protein